MAELPADPATPPLQLSLSDGPVLLEPTGGDAEQQAGGKKQLLLSSEVELHNAPEEAVAQSPEAGEDAEESLSTEHEFGDLSMTLIVMYLVANMTTSRAACVKAVTWLFFGLLIACLEILVLLSLTQASSWPSCRTTDDCFLGTACVRLVEAGTLQRPLCLDCYFLTDNPDHGSGAPWTHSVNGFGLPGTPEGRNATEICTEQVGV